MKDSSSFLNLGSTLLEGRLTLETTPRDNSDLFSENNIMLLEEENDTVREIGFLSLIANHLRSGLCVLWHKSEEGTDRVSFSPDELTKDLHVYAFPTLTGSIEAASGVNPDLLVVTYVDPEEDINDIIYTIRECGVKTLISESALTDVQKEVLKFCSTPMRLRDFSKESERPLNSLLDRLITSLDSTLKNHLVKGSNLLLNTRAMLECSAILIHKDKKVLTVVDSIDRDSSLNIMYDKFADLCLGQEGDTLELMNFTNVVNKAKFIELCRSGDIRAYDVVVVDAVDAIMESEEVYIKQLIVSGFVDYEGDLVISAKVGQTPIQVVRLTACRRVH